MPGFVGRSLDKLASHLLDFEDGGKVFWSTDLTDCAARYIVYFDPIRVKISHYQGLTSGFVGQAGMIGML